MNLVNELKFTREKLKRMDSRYKYKPIRISCGENIKLTLDLNGFITEAEGINFIMWFNVNEDINEKVIGMHIKEFLELLKVYTANPNNAESLDELIKKYYDFGILQKNEQNKKLCRKMF